MSIRITKPRTYYIDRDQDLSELPTVMTIQAINYTDRQVVKSLTISNAELQNMCLHSELARVKLIKEAGKQTCTLDIPHEMIECMDIMHVICSAYDKCRIYNKYQSFESLDLVPFLNLCGYLMIPDKMVYHWLRPFKWAGNFSLKQGIYWAKYLLPYNSVANLLLNATDIRPKMIPDQISSYREFRYRYRNMIRNDVRYHGSTKLNNDFRAHIYICRCERCRDPITGAFKFSEVPLQFTQKFPTHLYCAVCPIENYKRMYILTRKYITCFP